MGRILIFAVISLFAVFDVTLCTPNSCCSRWQGCSRQYASFTCFFLVAAVVVVVLFFVLFTALAVAVSAIPFAAVILLLLHGNPRQYDEKNDARVRELHKGGCFATK